MQKTPTIIHIYPESGGIFDYAKVIDSVYEAEGYIVKKITVNDTSSPSLATVSKSDDRIYHIEFGVNDYKLFWLSWNLAKTAQNKVIVTIHDPGTVIYNLSGILIPLRAGKLTTIFYRAVRKLLNSVMRRYFIPRWRKKNITRIYLNKRDANDGYYLPHPTYEQAPVDRKNRGKKSSSLKVGFSGYWGKWKGIDNLVEACERIVKKTKLTLVIAGKTVDDGDSYQEHVEKLAAQNSFIELPGFIEPQNFTSFLEGLDLLVLPYHLEIPGGVSGMAQRITELGLPVIATRTPALLGQIGEGNAIFVEPANTESLRQGIEEYLANQGMYDSRAEKLQKNLYKTNGWEEVGRLLTEIIKEVSSK
jgi:glycosyltransferase involved in cell wall biosynthesis